MAGFENDPRGMLNGFCGSGLLAACDLGGGRVETATILTLVVERRDDNVPPFAPHGVEAIVPHDVAPDAVILRIDLDHTMNIRLPGGVRVSRSAC
jgi:hypothetical protein